MANDVAAPLLELRHVGKTFGGSRDVLTRLAGAVGLRPAGAHKVRAVDDVSIAIAPGEVLGLVGESGCGKSTLGRIVAGVHPPSSGERLWKGEALDRLDAAQRRRTQLAIQMVFQDPYASLNPRLRVRDIIGEAPVVHRLIPSSQQDAFAGALLERVGLDAAALRRFPHQFSGGQRARIGIARALALRPELLVCDEAVAALDVSVQAQVLNLFMALRAELNLAYLFISHDLGVVRHLADRVAIMYLGRIVELAPSEAVFSRPNHPYTAALLAAAPKLKVRSAGAAVRDSQWMPMQPVSDSPSPIHLPSGCSFHPRCPHAMARCCVEVPTLRSVGPAHRSACHLNDPQ